MTGDGATAAVKLQAVLKSPRARMTIASLRAALDELEAVANVPVDADLTVVHYQQGGWEATAKWIPDAKPDAKPEGPGILSVEELAAQIQHDNQTARVGFSRPVRDAPQA